MICINKSFSVCNAGRKGDIFSKEYLLPSYLLASTFYEGGGGASSGVIPIIHKIILRIIFSVIYIIIYSVDNKP